MIFVSIWLSVIISRSIHATANGIILFFIGLGTSPLYMWITFFFLFFLFKSANTVPHYHKLCSRVSHMWGNRRGQHIWSAMDKPHPGKTTFVIMVSPLPGTYESHFSYPFLCWWTFVLFPCLSYCKWCCYEHWGSCIFSNYVFLQIYAQERDC